MDLRLILVDVEPGAGDPAFPQRFDELGLVDDGSTGRVDQKGGPLHHLELGGADEVTRVGQEGRVQRDEI